MENSSLTTLSRPRRPGLDLLTGTVCLQLFLLLAQTHPRTLTEDAINKARSKIKANGVSKGQTARWAKERAAAPSGKIFLSLEIRAKNEVRTLSLSPLPSSRIDPPLFSLFSFFHLQFVHSRSQDNRAKVESAKTLAYAKGEEYVDPAKGEGHTFSITRFNTEWDVHSFSSTCLACEY
jgi:hypothetical protein